MQTDHAQASDVPPKRDDAGDFPAKRLWMWLGVAGVSAAVTFVLIRTTMKRAPSDPTAQRIEALIDEANRLLKALEEQK